MSPKGEEAGALLCTLGIVVLPQPERGPGIRSEALQGITADGFLRSVMGARRSGGKGWRLGLEPESGQRALEEQPQTLCQRGPGVLEYPSAAGIATGGRQGR